MKPSNDPDNAIAQEWLLQLDAWFSENGYAGYDPFDIKQTPFIRSLQPYYLPRKASTVACDLFPNALRKILGVQKTENPKTYALVAHAKLRLFQSTQDERYLDDAKSLIEWLLDNPARTEHGTGWGYPFSVTAKGLHTPENTPILVVSVIVGQSILLAYELTGDDQYLAALSSIAQFILMDIPQLEEEDDTLCFAYAPTDHRRIHNANLLASEFLSCVAAVLEVPRGIEAAQKSLRFSLNRQEADGSWFYGEYNSKEPFEAGTLRFIDHHHTGFVLRSLNALNTINQDSLSRDALLKGFGYYKTLFVGNGMPITAFARYPVDIHACTEGILCPSILMDGIPGARGLAPTTMRWTYHHLRQVSSGAPYYRRYPGFTSPLVCTRWGVAWLYRALAEYCYQIGRAPGTRS